MKYFSIDELCRTSHPVLNTPGSAEHNNLTHLINNLLDPIREQWGRPITVNSGYRCTELNRMVGGVTTSQHARGEAADITAGLPLLNRQLFDLIVASGVAFDQLIDEKGYRWLHVSLKQTGKNRNEVLHLK